MKVYYDRLVDIVEVEDRKGSPKYVISAKGNVTIFADDQGVYLVLIEVHKWDEDVKEVEEKLKKIGAFIYE